MSDGFYYWYRQVWDTSRSLQLLDTLDRLGLRTANPATGLVTTLTSGPDSWGEQEPITTRELGPASGLVHGGALSLQLWLDAGTDLYTRFRALPNGGAAIEFGLDGLGEWQDRVVDSLSRAVHDSWQETAGYVIDRYGRTEDTEWDGVILDGGERIDGWPDELAVRESVAAHHAQLAGAEGMPSPPLVVFGRTS